MAFIISELILILKHQRPCSVIADMRFNGNVAVPVTGRGGP
jgi:hypothetical protein